MYGDMTVGNGESVHSNAAYADIVALEGMVFAFSKFCSTKPALVADLWCPLSFDSRANVQLPSVIHTLVDE